MNVTVGSKWVGGEVKFIVEAVDDDTVHYAKTDKFGFASDMKYNCLVGAFLERFRQTVE